MNTLSAKVPLSERGPVKRLSKDAELSRLSDEVRRAAEGNAAGHAQARSVDRLDHISVSDHCIEEMLWIQLY
jgi:hypothetical protein